MGEELTRAQLVTGGSAVDTQKDSQAYATVGGRPSQTPLFRVRSKNHGSFGPASFAITRVFEVAAVRPLVGSRPSGSVCDWQRPRGITGSRVGI